MRTEQNTDEECVEETGYALLRPSRRVKVHFRSGGEEQSVQLIVFPKPYTFASECSDCTVSISVVECDGSGVRLGLLMSQTSGDKTGTATRVHECRATFETDEAYRDWWYRLQRIRKHVERVAPVLRETQAEVG